MFLYYRLLLLRVKKVSSIHMKYVNVLKTCVGVCKKYSILCSHLFTMVQKLEIRPAVPFVHHHIYCLTLASITFLLNN